VRKKSIWKYPETSNGGKATDYSRAEMVGTRSTYEKARCAYFIIYVLKSTIYHYRDLGIDGE
jgi:hypothetical protein